MRNKRRGVLGVLCCVGILIVALLGRAEGEDPVARSAWTDEHSRAETSTELGSLASLENDKSADAGSKREPISPYANKRFISVRVVDESGQALTDADVLLVNAKREIQRRLNFSLSPPPRWAQSEQVGEEGEITFVDVPEGEWRVWGATDRTAFHASEKVTIGTEATSATIELELTKHPEDRLISGRVVGASGEPALGAWVLLSWEEGGTARGRRVSCLPTSSEFVFRLKEPVEGAMVLAHDAHGIQRDGLLRGVRSGARDLVLQLAPQQIVTFDIYGDTDDVRDKLTVQLEAMRGGRWTRINGPRASSYPDSLSLRAILPVETFRVRVFHSLFPGQTFGPYDPQLVPERNVLELAPAPRIRGRVLAGKFPAKGALVSTSGGLTLSQPDLNGQFEVACFAEGEVVLEAEHRKLGSVTSPSIPVPSAGPFRVDLVYTEFGSIRGVVRLPADYRQNQRTILWMFNAELGKASRGLIEADGSLYVPNLRAGSWTLSLHNPFAYSLRQEDVSPGIWAAYVKSGVPPSRPCFLVAVAPGEETPVHLDFGMDSECEVRGVFRFHCREEWAAGMADCLSGVPLPDVRLLTPNGRGLINATRQNKERFRLGASRPGSYRVQVTEFNHNFGLITFWSDLKVEPGVNDWSFENTAGRIRVRLEPEFEGDERRLSFKWNDGAGQHASGSLERYFGSEFTAFSAVPSGRVEIFFREESGEERSLAVVQVGPDEDLEIYLER